MTPLGKFLKATYMIRVYKDGGGHGFIWRWWNPLVWVFAPLCFVGAVLAQGIPETLKYPHEIGFGVKPWFIEHPERLEWLP